MKDLHEQFLAYLEGTLSASERESLEKSFREDPKLASDYNEFVKVNAALGSMSVNGVKAPEGFDLVVMKAIGELSPVNKWSSSMSSIRKKIAKVVDRRRFVYVLAPSFASIAVLMIIYKAQPGVQVLTNEGESVNLLTGVNAPTEGTPNPVPYALQSEGGEQYADLIVAFKNDIEGQKKSVLPKSVPAQGANIGRGLKGQMVLDGSREANFAALDTDYGKAVENGYLDALNVPLSTFSIDVDTGSYSNVRRYLSNSELPPADVVRTEELLNYFKYDYKAPSTKEVPFAVYTELGSAPWEPKHQLLHVGLKGYEEDISELPASNLVFLVDVSGSMDSPDKLPLLKQGLKLLVEKLKPEDRLSVVTYAGTAGVVFESKSGTQKAEILSAIDSFSPGGSTAGAAGIGLAYEIAKKNFIQGANNRVILATDGDFNVGVSSDQELVRLIEEKRKSGVFLSVLGFGTGDYQDKKMEQLANKGNGSYYFIDNILEAKKVLVQDLKGTLFTIAKDVKIQIEFNPAYVQAYRLIGYENRMLAKEDFNDDKKDAGELGSGHSVTALYEIVPVGVDFNQVASVDDLKYQRAAPSPSPVKVQEMNHNEELATIKLRYKLPAEEQSKLISQVINSNPIAGSETSNNFRFAASVAEFGMLLRDSEYKGSATFATAIELARGAKGEDALGYRADYIKLLETAELLKKK
jgi:Ca-activated chloride channel family protein